MTVKLRRHTKPWWQSLTFWGLILTLAGTVLTMSADGQSVLQIITDPHIQADLGHLLQFIGITGAGIGRAKASQPWRAGR